MSENFYRGDKKIKTKDNLIFQTLSWEKKDRYAEMNEENYEYDSNDSNDSEEEVEKKIKERNFMVKAYGITEKGESVYLEIEGFQPYFFLKIPDKWNSADIVFFIKKLKNMIFEYKKVNKAFFNDDEIIFHKKPVKRKDLYGFDNFADHTFFKISFKSDSSRWNFKKAISDDDFNTTMSPTDISPSLTKPIRIYENNIRLPIYEANVDSLIRFIDIAEINPSGWISIEKKNLKNSLDDSRCQLNYLCHYKDISFVDKADIAPFRVSSFDIECTSCDGSFPQAQRKDDKVIQIGTTTRVFGQKYCFVRHIICLKQCESIPDISYNEEKCEEKVIIESCNTEKDVLLAWTKHIQRIDPDIIIGYNIFGFDWKYLYDRAKLVGCSDEFSQIGRNIGECKIISKQLSSSAMGQNFLNYPQLEGRVQIDLLKVIQREHNLSSYKLDSVAEHFMGLNKHDLPPDQIFKKFKNGSPEDIKIIAEYCLQDCVLVNNLFDKLNILPNSIGMSNVCYVPMELLFLRGQGIKVFSLLAKTCRMENHAFPTLKKLDFNVDTTGYEGAIVFDPLPGLYFEPIAVLDYKSLYPSSEIEFNISHETLVTDEKYLGLEGFRYNEIEFDVKNNNGDVIGKKKCVYAEKLPTNDEEKENPGLCKGIVPRLLEKLLAARSSTKKLMKEVKGTYMEAVYDGLQLAYKVTCNSVYGYFGAKFSDLRWQDLAASTTAAGRKRLHFAEEQAEQFLGVKVVYGDSVAPHTPLLLKRGDNIFVETIDSIVSDYKEIDGKLYGKPEELFVWTEKGWTLIQNVMKHKVNKKMYRVLTHTGLVDVTEDHSLLSEDGKEVSPKDIEVGMKLLHSFPKKIDSNLKIIDKELAFVYGFFFAEGTCGAYVSEKYGNKYSWGIVHQDPSILFYCQSVFNKFNINTKILDCIKSSAVYKLVPVGNIKKMVLQYRNMFYDKKSYKKIPYEIINSSNDVIESFWEGYYYGDGDHDKNGYTRCDIKGQIGAMGMYYLLKKIGYNVSINCRKDKIDIFRLTCTTNIQRKNPNVIKKIIELPENFCEYVYDLTTENHHFHAGVGQLIVHNTDSIFINCSEHPSVKGKSGKEALEATIELGKIIAEKVTNLLRYPQELEYEKTFWPFLIITKKRYAGHLYEFDPNKFKFKSMGLVTKRRDNAPIVKIIFQGIIDILFNARDVGKAVKFYQDNVKDLLEGKVSTDKLVVTKTLKATYKIPTQITHKVLAEKIADRDPGNAPVSSERIPYIFINEKELKCKICNITVNVKNCKCKRCMYLFCSQHLSVKSHSCKGRCRMCWKKDTEFCNVCGGGYCSSHRMGHNCTTIKTEAIQGDLAETPKYIEENKIKIDYRYYLEHQITKPVQQIFDLIEDTKNKDILKQELIEDNNRKNRVKSITAYFKIKK